MMYIEHTNLEDNLHQILTNRVPTSSSPSASEGTAAIAASALLARVREVHNSAPSTLQQTTSSPTTQFQNHRQNISTPNYYKTAAKEWIKRPEPNLLPLEHFNTTEFPEELRKVSTTFRNSTSPPEQEKQLQLSKEEKEEEQYELLHVTDSGQTVEAENFKVLKVERNVEQKDIYNCASTSHFEVDLRDGQKNSTVAAPAATFSQVQVDEDEDFEYVVTRVPKRKLQQPSTSQTFEANSTLKRKVRRPVPEAIPITLYPGIRSHNGLQLPSPPELVIPQQFKNHTIDSQKYKTHRELNGLTDAAAYYVEHERHCEDYSDLESVEEEEASTGRSANAYNNEFFSKQEAQMGIDILNKLRHLFNWNPSTNHYSTAHQEGKRKRRSDHDWSAGESAGPQQIKYRKVESHFPKYIATRSEEDDINEYFPTYSHRNQQHISQKYDKQLSLNNSAQSSKPLLEMSNRRSTPIDKPPLRKSMFTAPPVSEQLLKNTAYADVEFSDDDEPILRKGLRINPPTLASAKRVPEVFNIPIMRTDERFKSSQQKSLPPPLIETSTGNILQSSLLPALETRRKPTYAETLRQSAGAGHVLGGRSGNSSPGASTSESTRILNGLFNFRTNHLPGQSRSSILNKEKESDERDKYQQLLEQVVPRLYSSSEYKLSSASSSKSAVPRRRSAAVLLGPALISSARSSTSGNTRSIGLCQQIFKHPPLSSTINLDDDDVEDNAAITNLKTLRSGNTRSVGIGQQNFKRPPLSSTINLDDDDVEDDAAITNLKTLRSGNTRSIGLGQQIFKRPPLSSTMDHDDVKDVAAITNLKTLRSSKAKPSTVIVDDDEISDIIDVDNEERQVLSACSKIQKEQNAVINLYESKAETPKKNSLPFVEPVNSLQERFNASPHIKDNWLQNWQSKWLQRKKNRHDEVKETVKVTEKLTAERRAAEAEIQERLREFQIVDPELLVVDDFEDAIEEPEFVELTPDMKARIHAAVMGPLDQVLVSKFNLNITRRDIHTLCGHNWLNDEVINFYMNLLTERGEKKHDSHGLPRVYAMNTFFIPRLLQAGHAGVKRWTRKVDIFEKDVIPVPVHVGGVHWCMAIIHLKNRSIKYYDSMGTPNPSVLKALEKYLKDESMDKRKQPFDTNGFLIESVQGVPRQMNGSDCGVFSCMFAEYITRNREITFSQHNMEYFRQKMILEIVMGELLH